VKADANPSNARPPKRWRRRLALLAGLGTAFWLLSSWLVADQLTRRSGTIRAEPVPVLAWGSPSELRLQSEDGEELGAWFFAGRKDQPAVLLLHGNGGTRADCLDQAEWLVNGGHSVLLVTLRAHGDSTGERNDFGFSARQDVFAAVAWLERQDCARPVIWGRSLGAAAALFAAGELGPRVSGYILECPYRDLRSAVRNRTRARLPVFADWLAYTGLSLTAPLVLEDVDRISPLGAADGVPKDTPILILAGSLDRRATPDDAAAIGNRIGPSATVVVFEDADHLGLHRADPIRYRELGLRFVCSCRPADH
jgi:alpha-beta hydrolase superfamily lysophospholipase